MLRGRKVLGMMNLLKKYVVGGAAAAVLTLSGPALASTIVNNGSFENGLTGWTVSRGTVDLETTATAPLPAQDGTAMAELVGTTNALLRQTVSLHTGRYVLSLWYSPEAATRAANSRLGWNMGGIISGVLSTANGATVGNWVQLNVEFLVQNTRKYQLSLANFGKAGAFVDNVAIAPVPVPAAGVVLLGALGALAGLRRRKKA